MITRRRNLDTIVHLDDSSILFELNVVTGDDPHIEVNYTDDEGERNRVRYDREQAGAFWFLVKRFDRRAVVEFADALHQGIHDIMTAEDGQ